VGSYKDLSIQNPGLSLSLCEVSWADKQLVYDWMFDSIHPFAVVKKVNWSIKNVGIGDSVVLEMLCWT
jgi:hypothetical protein